VLYSTFGVATLALGSRPRQRACKGVSQKGAWESRQRHCKGVGQEEVWESHHKLPGVLESVREYEGMNEPSHSQGNSHFGKWSPSGFPKLQRAIVGVKPQMSYGVPYIIGKLLERRCLKWAHIAHLESET